MVSMDSGGGAGTVTGGGSAFRSTFPFGVSGSAWSVTVAAGTMYSGSFFLR